MRDDISRPIQNKQSMRRAPAARAWSVLAALATLGTWAGVVIWLLTRPAIDVPQARGLYAAEGGARAFRWTDSEARLPLASRDGPTEVRLTLGRVPWDGVQALDVRLGGGGWRIPAMVGPQPRRYVLLLPPGAGEVVIQAPVARPAGDWRWLGVQLYAAEAHASGLPLHLVWQALLLALASAPLMGAAAWFAARGHAAPVTLFGIALALRLAWMGDSPPGLHRDEVVSLVDAWHVLTTGRDHYGHILPLAAFEAFGDWIAPLLTYLEIPAVAILGPEPGAARGTTAVISALAVPVVYAVARELHLPRAAAFTGALVAALSPWQIFLGRIAMPPSLAPTCWGVCLLAGLRLVAGGARRDALVMALAAGVALYAYPPLKLGVPLLVVATALLACPQRSVRAAIAAWWPAGVLLGALWLPFIADALFNTDSGRRLAQIALRADSPAAWLAAWWGNYRVYFGADFWYLSGGLTKAIQGIPGRPLALPVEAALALPGLAALALQAAWSHRKSGVTSNGTHATWLLALLALLIAPFPGSLTERHPNAYRAAPLAFMYAVVIAAGAAVAWNALGRIGHARWRTLARGAAVAALAGAMAWQCGSWYRELLTTYPRIVAPTWFFADRAIDDAMRLAIAEAPAFDEAWFDTDSIGRPYIYLLAARPLPAAEAQAQLVVRREPPEPNFVDAIGPYRFANLDMLPYDLPTLHAVVDRFSAGGYLIQELRDGERRILVVRGMNMRVADVER